MLPSRFYLDNIFDDFMDKDKDELMKCDVYEKEGKYHIVSDMPGFKKEDLNVDVSDGYLTIVAEKREENEDKEGKKFIRKERFYGKVSRKFYVGDVLESEIKAEFKDGVLSIEIPKAEKEKTKKTIEIK